MKPNTNTRAIKKAVQSMVEELNKKKLSDSLIEDEKKYLIKLEALTEIIDKCGVTPKRIIQAYVATGSPEVRLRVTDEKLAELTVKIGKGQKRIELEAEYNLYRAREIIQSLDLVIRKSRYSYHRFSIDVYHGPLTGLIIAEVEFPSKEWFGSTYDWNHPLLKVPDWLQPFVVREVTNEAEYKNQNLAKRK